MYNIKTKLIKMSQTQQKLIKTKTENMKIKANSKSEKNMIIILK